MGPFSETTMTATDRMFGRSYSYENLKQLGGFEALMRKAAQRPGHGISRDVTKWFHAPLYAELCITQLFIFLDHPLEMFTNYINTMAESDDEQDRKLLSSIREQLDKLDSTERRSLLRWEAMQLGTGVILLEEIVQRLRDSGRRDPDVLETRQLCSIITRMMCANEPLHLAALIYQDSCVADTTKSATFTLGLHWSFCAKYGFQCNSFAWEPETQACDASDLPITHVLSAFPSSDTIQSPAIPRSRPGYVFLNVETIVGQINNAIEDLQREIAY
ncbi:hypothetical protein BTUL_0420g00030 [Botrytis tulipae]|uniref:Uncharacterized protein n=1 Tax=Botrytis tulipae TaxID=87230 RepID=A0A4Z1E6B8_9HELO|nr:hypothetical protein BTUL_0420g00030 [Botrytis tulipae]